LHKGKVLTKSRTSRAKVERGSAAGYSKGLAKREEILVGLMNALVRGELRNPSLRAVGQALGIEPAHILYYFGGREELMQAAIVRWDEDAINRNPYSPSNGIGLDEYVTTIGNNVARPGIVDLYLAFAAEALESSYPAHEFIRKRFGHARNSLAGAIRREQEVGKIVAEVDAEIEVRPLIALADGLQLQSLIDPGVDAVAHIATAIAQLRTGT